MWFRSVDRFLRYQPFLQEAACTASPLYFCVSRIQTLHQLVHKCPRDKTVNVQLWCLKDICKRVSKWEKRSNHTTAAKCIERSSIAMPRAASMTLSGPFTGPQRHDRHLTLEWVHCWIHIVGRLPDDSRRGEAKIQASNKQDWSSQKQEKECAEGEWSPTDVVQLDHGCVLHASV